MARHPQLEAKLLENPADVDARLVYADFLQSNGDPRGELIVLQHRGKTEEADAYIEKHAEALLGPLARFKMTFDHDSQPAFQWHLGFIKSAKLGYESNAEIDDEDPDECTADLVVAALLQHPSAMLLEELTVTMNMLDDGMYFDNVCKAIAAHGAPALRSLRLGEFQHAGPGGVENGYDYEISWSSLGDASGMWKVLPRLERLRIQLGLGGSSANGDDDIIGTFDLPKLRHLEVVTGGMGSACVKSFAAGKLPAIEHFEIWLGSDNYGGTGTVADLEALFAGDGVPKLRHLGLRNAQFTDEIALGLARSKLLPRLAEVDLSHGMMTDAGAQAIIDNAAAFKHLKSLDVGNNYIGGALTALRGACTIVSDEQRDPAEEYRYVALAE